MLIHNVPRYVVEPLTTGFAVVFIDFDGRRFVKGLYSDRASAEADLAGLRGDASPALPSASSLHAAAAKAQIEAIALARSCASGFRPVGPVLRQIIQSGFDAVAGMRDQARRMEQVVLGGAR
jgi:hypothetical protein